MQAQEFDLEDRGNFKALRLQFTDREARGWGSQVTHSGSQSCHTRARSLSLFPEGNIWGHNKGTEQCKGTGQPCTHWMPLEVTLQLPNGKTSSPSLRMPEGKGSEPLKHCCHHQNPRRWWPCGWPRFLRKAISRTGLC